MRNYSQNNLGISQTQFGASTIRIPQQRVYLIIITSFFKPSMEKSCMLYIRPETNPPNSDDVKKALSSGTLSEKYKALKQLIRSIISEESYPRLIMHVITTIIPVVNDSPELRKAMVIYWEIVQKSKSPTDSDLKDQMFLACNSLRNDLLSPNEYLRARTLRLVSRCMHRGIIQPLSNAIIENLQHKSSYVRRNAVVCLYQVFLSFGDETIGDIDELVQKLLLTQTDLSTKRNAFLLLYQSNESKAMSYIQMQINNQSLNQMGDILQLAILEVFRKKCKEDPNQKPKLLKMIIQFSKNASDSVILQCAISLTAISMSSGTLKNALNAYVSILTSSSELNVKKVILDRIQSISSNSKYLQDVIGDLLKVLQTPSAEIKQKILQIIRHGLTSKNIEKVIETIKHELTNCEDEDYQKQLIQTLEYLAFNFEQYHQKVFNTIIENVFVRKSLQPVSCRLIKEILIRLLEDSKSRNDLLVKLIDNFSKIQQAQLYKGLLYIFGTYITQKQIIVQAIDKIRISLGSLPLVKGIQMDSKQINPENQVKKVQKTIILEDGSYATKTITEQDLHKEITQEKNLRFRELILQDSILGGVMVRNLARLFYKVRKDDAIYSKYGLSILMILCSLVRYYQGNIYEFDQSAIDQITYVLRAITNPQKFKNQSDELFQADFKLLPQVAKDESSSTIQKYPEQIIVFRQLKPKGNSLFQFNHDDEEITETKAEETNNSTQLISKLKTLVQLTGYFDPIYAQTFVTVKNYDVFFEILLINIGTVNLLNVQIQFTSKTQISVLQKAQTCNIKPGESVTVRSHIKFANSEFGSLFGSINYDNQAGIQQAYLVTEEIKIDFLQFIIPVAIPLSSFRSLWKQITFQESVSKETSNENINHILRQHQHHLHSKVIDMPSHQQDLVNAHLYGKSRLGQDILVTLIIDRKEDKTQLDYVVKAKDKGIVNLICQRIRQFKLQEEEETQ